MSSSFVLFALAFTPLFAQPAKMEIKPSPANRLVLHVFKTGLYKGKVHEFVFPSYRGAAIFDAAKPENSTVGLTIDAASIKLTDTWLSASDFKKVQEYALDDMLNVKKWKEITFESSSVRQVDSTHYAVTGTLTIRGVAKPASVNVQVAPGPRFEGAANVRLTAFGLKPPSAGLGLIGTKDEIDLSFVINIH